MVVQRTKLEYIYKGESQCTKIYDITYSTCSEQISITYSQDLPEHPAKSTIVSLENVILGMVPKFHGGITNLAQIWTISCSDPGIYPCDDFVDASLSVPVRLVVYLMQTAFVDLQ